jgi:peptidoglycan biosynthesis protein MviN/MurJ (putative lipid II flippase)
MAQRLIFGFAAGFIAVLLFQQPVVALLHAHNIGPAAYSIQRMPPFGLPIITSQALVSGVIGALLLLIVDRKHGERFWLFSLGLALGGFLPGLMMWLAVAPIEHQWWMPKLLLDPVPNAAWVFGTFLIYRGFLPRRHLATSIRDAQLPSRGRSK